MGRLHVSVSALRQGVLSVALYALVQTAVTLVEVILLCHLVGTAMSHVKVVANPLLLLVPTAVSMQSRRQVCPALPVPVLLFRRRLWLRRLFRHVLFIILCLALQASPTSLSSWKG